MDQEGSGHVLYSFIAVEWIARSGKRFVRERSEPFSLLNCSLKMHGHRKLKSAEKKWGTNCSENSTHRSSSSERGRNSKILENIYTSRCGLIDPIFKKHPVKSWLRESKEVEFVKDGNFPLQNNVLDNLDRLRIFTELHYFEDPPSARNHFPDALRKLDERGWNACKFLKDRRRWNSTSRPRPFESRSHNNVASGARRDARRLKIFKQDYTPGRSGDRIRTFRS